jgi:hypothetical protein
MDHSIHHPSCFALFDPLAPECANCEIQAACMKEQAAILAMSQAESQQVRPENPKAPNPPQNGTRKETPSSKPKPIQSLTSGEEQFIPEHTRKPLEIPPVGSTIQTTYRGQLFEAVIVDDPANKRMEGRSILFKGTVFRTLTAAARAISPGINSGTVWQVV